jgi:phosphinothricin acetyltransferase
MWTCSGFVSWLDRELRSKNHGATPRFRPAPVLGGTVATMDIRHASYQDAPALQTLRNHYIARSHATFDETALSLEHVQAWIASFPNAEKHHLLLASSGSGLLGFCSSQPYRAHPAFTNTVETSVYVSATTQQRGIGSALYETLFALLENAGLHRAVVGIALPNPASIALHTKFGFRTVGVFSEYAVKNGHYISSQWMERSL